MPTLKLYYNTSNSIPSSSDPIHYRSFTVDFVDDRSVEEIKDSTLLLNKSIAEDIYGIRRKLQTFLRTDDIKNNIDFLTSFYNAPYKWALVGDSGYYYNLGTIASPIAVPVIPDSKEPDISVPGILREGIKLKTAQIFQRPAAPVAADWGAVDTGADSSISWTLTDSLKINIYRSSSSGGAYSYRMSDTASPYIDSNGAGLYYKITKVTIGGESELSNEEQSGGA
jgi:hypothetical protein